MNRRRDLSVVASTTLHEISVRKPKRLVLIKHPHLDEPLFSFPAFSADTSTVDAADSTGMRYGVFRPLVLDACRVLTNHAASSLRDEDFLATDKDGHNRVPINNAPLDVDCYYFLGPPLIKTNCNYPIVKSLSAFTFPSVLPERWAKIAEASGQQPDPSQPPAPSQMSGIVRFRDRSCAITRWRDFTQCAHLIPKTEEDWFIAHKLAIYINEDLTAGINDPANGLLLRSDVHLCLVSHGFVFFPDNEPDIDQRFVAYFVKGGYHDSPELIHLRPATIHPGIPVQFLYARFAYAMINLPRQNILFASIPESERFKAVQKARKEQKPAKKISSKTRENQSTFGSISEEGGDGDVAMSGADEEAHAPGNDDEPDIRSSSTSSNRSIQSPREDTDEGDKRWRQLLFERIPELSKLPEVDDPPETFTGSHVETPHMLRLRSEYIKRNPQVWRTSTTPSDATREDVEGFHAHWLTQYD